MTKEEVIAGSLWQVTVYAAFQRAKVYRKGATNKDRQGVKETLRAEIKKVLPEYRSRMTEIKHINRIVRIKNRIDQKWSHVLQRREIPIGVVQKAFNLYLKLMWCRGKILEPPHCPVDKVIIDKLPCVHRTAWTRIRHINEYIRLIGELKSLAARKKKSLAKWELVEYKKP